MVNFKKMDDRDFVFINKPLDEKDEMAFSEFLRKRKAKIETPKKKRTSSRKLTIS